MPQRRDFMALTNFLDPNVVNDINTIGNVTSAGLGIATLRVAQQSLDVAEETLRELDRNDKWARRNEELNLQLISQMVALLNSIDKKLSQLTTSTQ